jgi:putative SOS response-associated peptidase YedK
VEEDGTRTAQTFKWGLIPFWAKDRKIANQTLNARAETIASKPAFRSAFKRRRLLILADGFYEWERKDKKTRLPHLFQMKDGRPFAMAGVWEPWTDPESGDELRTCSIVTTSPNPLMEPIHDRMPVLLPETAWDTWLDPEVNDPAALQELLVPFPADKMKERRVSTKVNDVKNKGADVQDDPEPSQA